jgi:hypothetical protein
LEVHHARLNGGGPRGRRTGSGLAGRRADESGSGSVSFAGTWQGVVAGEPAWVSLTQQGSDVAGTLRGMALVGRAEGASLSFSLTGAGPYCAVSASGSATAVRMADRDRLQLSYYGADSCNETFSGSGWLDRLRCAGGMLACGGGQAEGWMPYCAHGQTDASNCGYCGLKCGQFQACAAGECQLHLHRTVRLEAPPVPGGGAPAVARGRRSERVAP